MSHNEGCVDRGVEPIRKVMCPGLGTAVGRMPFVRCAEQMVAAYESVVFRTLTEFLEPQSLTEPVLKHLELKTAGKNKDKALTSKPLPGEIFIPQQEEEDD